MSDRAVNIGSGSWCEAHINYMIPVRMCVCVCQLRY
jgi:hypothetical protein